MRDVYNMPLANKEKTMILISQAISVYSYRLQQGKISAHQSVIDFISKNVPEQYKSELSM